MEIVEMVEKALFWIFCGIIVLVLTWWVKYTPMPKRQKSEEEQKEH